MLLSAVSVLVVAQSSSEVPEGLMNNPVYIYTYIRKERKEKKKKKKENEKILNNCFALIYCMLIQSKIMFCVNSSTQFKYITLRNVM